MIKFNFNFLDEWNGEVGYTKLDGRVIWTQYHKWCEKLMPWYCKKYGIDSCGSELPDKM